MCDLITAAVIGGTVLQANAGYQQSKQAEANAKSQALELDRKAKAERMAGAYRAGRLSNEAERLAATQRAMQTEGGMAPQGSALDVQEDSAYEADLDIQAIMWNADGAATSLNQSAKVQRVNARNHRSAAPVNFLSPILSNAARFPKQFGLT